MSPRPVLLVILDAGSAQRARGERRRARGHAGVRPLASQLPLDRAPGLRPRCRSAAGQMGNSEWATSRSAPDGFRFRTHPDRRCDRERRVLPQPGAHSRRERSAGRPPASRPHGPPLAASAGVALPTVAFTAPEPLLCPARARPASRAPECSRALFTDGRDTSPTAALITCARCSGRSITSGWDAWRPSSAGTGHGSRPPLGADSRSVRGPDTR